jgi:hypothetical protein
MAARPISSQVHGILDYTTGATLTALPALLGIGGTRAGRVLRAAGLTTVAYSALTRYELGAAKVLPYRGHLALDAVAAAGLAAAPFLLGTRDEGPRHWVPHVALGVFELGAVALSDPAGGGADLPADAAPAPSTTAPTAPAAPAAAGATTALGEPAPGAGPAAFDVAADAHRERTERTEVVMPDGVEANAGIGARTIGVGTASGGGGVGSGSAEPASPNAKP